MRLALVTQNIIRGDGQGRVNFELVRNLLGRGVRFKLLANQVAPELIAEGAEHVPLRPWVRRPDLLSVWQFAQLTDGAVEAIRGDVDLIIANGFTLRRPHHVNVSHFVSGAWLKSPAHVSRQTHGPYAWYQKLFSSMNAKWEQRAYAAAQVVIAVSQTVRRELIGIGVAQERIRVVENGVDLQEFHPGDEGRADLGLPTAAPLALFVGDIRTPRKNLDGVLRALVQTPEVHLAVVGALERSPFPRLAVELGVERRTHFLDFRSDVARIMRACDVLLCPSRYEPFGLTVLEALASGVPVITAAAVGASSLVSEENGVVISNPEDIDALAHAIRHVTADQAFRRHAPAAARATAEKHGWAQMADAYFKIFEEALRNSAPVPARYEVAAR